MSGPTRNAASNLPNSNFLNQLFSNAISDLTEGIDFESSAPRTIEEMEKQDRRIRNEYLMRGALFNGGWIEELPYNAAMKGFYERHGKYPFFSPEFQFSHLNERYIGLLSMLYLPEAFKNAAKNKPLPLRVPPTGEFKKNKTAEHIGIKCSKGKWPANTIIVYHFGDPLTNARAAYDFLTWHHKASAVFPEFFNNGHIRSALPQLDLKPGYYVVEIPPEDWERGIGRSTMGKSVDEARANLKDGWQFMGWEGLQLFAIFPYYPLLMEIPGLIPKMILPGLEIRQSLKSKFFAVPSVKFSIKEAELQLSIKEKHQTGLLYGAGLVRYLGPLEDFI